MSKKLKDIFDANYSPLCNYANSMIHDKHLAKDIVQSVFIQLWENQKITKLENPTPYLLRCVKYKSLDYLKQPARKKEIFSNELPDSRKEEIQILKEEDILPMLHYFAEKLPPKMQEVFLLSRQQNMTYREIASALNLSIKTIENHMGSALKKLRQLLKQHHYLSLLLIFLQ